MFILYEQVEYLSAILLRLDVNGICWGFYWEYEERLIILSIQVSYFVSIDITKISTPWYIPKLLIYMEGIPLLTHKVQNTSSSSY